MDKKHVIENAHKQIDALFGMWNCCGITATEAACILATHTTRILQTDIDATNAAINKPSISEVVKARKEGRFDKVDNLDKLTEELDKELPKIHIDKEPIPPGIYYNLEHDNFYSVNKHKDQGHDFYRKWINRRAEFPKWDGKESN